MSMRLGNRGCSRSRDRGATFESLAKRFLPGMPLAEVVALACRTANVGTLPGGADRPLWRHDGEFIEEPGRRVLAQNILHVRQIFDTCLYNVHRDPDDDLPGRLERMVSHVLSTKEFEKFQGGVRGQLHDVCERVDRLLKSGAERSSTPEIAPWPSRHWHLHLLQPAL